MTSDDIKHQFIIINVKQHLNVGRHRDQELCRSRGGRPGLPVANSPYGLCGRKATFKHWNHRAQKLCEIRVAVLGSASLTVLMVNVCRKATFEEVHWADARAHPGQWTRWTVAGP